MFAPPPNPSTNSSLLNTYSALIQTLCSFLTVSIHHILYLRSIYPRTSFLSTRAYNFPARQSRHPAVCAWINSAIDAVRDQLEKNTVEKVALCIFEVERNIVLETWAFDLDALPMVEKVDADTPFERHSEADAAAGGQTVDETYVANLEAQFRAVLSRISSASTRLSPLPQDNEFSFTLSIELRENADRPTGRLEKDERKWIVAEPEPWDPPEGRKLSHLSNNDGKAVSVRRLDAGQLRMEVWVEESRTKLAHKNATSAAD